MLGWPFLVAPGRRRDHTTIMAPGVLVEQLDYGVLEEQTSPGPPRTVEARSARGRRLFIAYWTEPVDDVRDEHGRPLRMIYGFVCFDGTPAAVDNTDRQAALDAVRSAYRAFLADEDGHAVEPSAPFTLHSPALTMTAAPDRSPPSLPAWLIGASALVILAVVAGVALLIGRPTSAVDGGPPPVPSLAPSVAPSAAPSPVCAAPSPSDSRSPGFRFRRSPGSSGSPALPAPNRSPCPG